MRNYLTAEYLCRLARGQRYWVHTYCLPEVDDQHIACAYDGLNDHGDHIFLPLDPLENAVYGMIKLDQSELEQLVFTDERMHTGGLANRSAGAA